MVLAKGKVISPAGALLAQLKVFLISQLAMRKQKVSHPRIDTMGQQSGIHLVFRCRKAALSVMT